MSSPVWLRLNNLIELGRAQDALDEAVSLLSETPADVELLCLAARAHLALGHTRQGLATAREAMGVDPDEPWAHRLCAIALTAMRRPGPATAAGQVAVRLAPHDWRSHQVLSAAAAGGDAPQRALARRAAAQAVELAPDVPDTHFAVGYAASRAGDRKTARAAYRRALELNPSHANARNNLAALIPRWRLVERAETYAGVLGEHPQHLSARLNIDQVGLDLLQWFSLLGWLGLVAAWILGHDDVAAHRSARWALGLTLLPCAAAWVAWTLHRLAPAVVAALRSGLGADAGARLAALSSLGVYALSTLALFLPGSVFSGPGWIAIPGVAGANVLLHGLLFYRMDAERRVRRTHRQS